MTHRRFNTFSITNAARHMLIILAVSMTYSCTPITSSESLPSRATSTQSLSQNDPIDNHATSVLADHSDAATPGVALTNTLTTPSDEQIMDALVTQNHESLLFGTPLGDENSWSILALPLLGTAQLPMLLDQLTNQALLDLLDPPSLPSSPTFLEQSCRNRGLPDFICRQRYGP